MVFIGADSGRARGLGDGGHLKSLSCTTELDTIMCCIQSDLKSPIWKEFALTNPMWLNSFGGSQ